MKKIIALLLLLTMTFCLVGCTADLVDEIQKHRDEYTYVPPVVEEMTLDVYIICDQSTQSARDAVTRQINLYTEDKFKTKLKITYVESSEYETTVMNNLDTADLILITNKGMMDTLVEQGKVADLTAFFSSDKYGSLNVDIAEALLEAALMPIPQDSTTLEDGTDPVPAAEGDGTTEETVPKGYFAIPNNRVLGSYTYLCVNKNTVHHQMMYPLNKLEAYPYIYSLDMGTTEANVARLIRGIMLRDMLASKDPVAMAGLQKQLFNQMVIAPFNITYGMSDLDPGMASRSAKALLSIMNEEELALTLELYQAWYSEAYPESNMFSDDLLKFVENHMSGGPDVEALLTCAKEAYTRFNFNYPGIVDPDTTGVALRSYPTVADMIAWFMSTWTTPTYGAGMLTGFTPEEIDQLYNYADNCATYLEEVKSGALDMSAYAAYDAVLLSGVMYEDKAVIEAAGWVCNVVETPTITADDAFASAFAVVTHEGDAETYVDRVMEIIYAFNKDPYLHNLLLYGVENMNYNLVNGEVNFFGDDYRMNPLYTGNIFTSYYCEELGFSKEAAEYGALQNKDAVVYKEAVATVEE